MADENPYSAPQTIEMRMPTALPVAELGARSYFPELSTAELRLLAARSQEIDNMSLLWVVLVMFPGVALVLVNVWTWFGFALIALLRAWTGNQRTPGYWKLNLSLDVIVFLASLGFIVFAFCIVLFTAAEIPVWLIMVTLVLILAMFSGLSVRAHLIAKTLYGNYPHRLLIQEVVYRKRHCIQ